MKKIFIASIVFLVIAGISTTVLSEEIVHTVKKGDTLWDISIMYLKTPWNWPIVWANNKDVTNPHLIYPGDKIIIRKNEKGAEIVIVRDTKSSPDVYTPEQFIQQKEKTLVVSPEYSSLIYSSTPIKGLGEFLDKEDSGGFATFGDTILVKMTTPMKPGEGFALVSMERKIKDKFKVMGFFYRIAAIAKIEDVQGDIARCKIIYAIQEVKKGDIAYTLQEIKPLTLNLSFPQIKEPAKVIDLYGGITKISAYDVVFVNAGTIQGVTPGSVLSIYEPTSPYESVDEYRGMALVIKTLENSSMGIVLEARAEIEKHFMVKGTEK